MVHAGDTFGEKLFSDGEVLVAVGIMWSEGIRIRKFVITEKKRKEKSTRFFHQERHEDLE